MKNSTASKISTVFLFVRYFMLQILFSILKNVKNALDPKTVWQVSVLTLIFLFQFNTILAQDLVIHKDISLTPSVVIHDTVIGPDQILLQVDALNFLGDDGQIGAITLRIDIDTLLLDFQGIQNPALSGSWLANYNYQEHEITITYTAPFGVGYDLNGKLLDLNLIYQGGFPAELNFKSLCEISNSSLQTIDSVTYDNGIISQSSPEGSVYQDTIPVFQGEVFEMPIVAQGVGFDMVTGMHLRISYDTAQLIYMGHVNNLLTTATVEQSFDILTMSWDGAGSFVDLTVVDTLLYLQFQSKSDSNSQTAILPGSVVYVNEEPVASDFKVGQVLAILTVDLFNQPDTAGVSTGSGNYFIGDSVFIQALPEVGFAFNNWTSADTVVSNNSSYVYVKQRGYDSLTAHYSPNTYELSIVVTPSNGGTTEGEGLYPFGENVTVTAIPEPGFEFICWIQGSDILSYDLSYSFTMPSNDLSLTASFELSTVPEGTVCQDTIPVVQGQSFNMPIIAQGSGFDMVTEMTLYVSYDTTQIVYLSHANELLTSATIDQSSDVLTMDWNGAGSSVDLTEADTLLYLQFQFVGDNNSRTVMLPGCIVYNNGEPVITDFKDGQVLAILSVELFNQPDTAGVSTGSGNYFIGDSVFIQALPEVGFAFNNWTSADTVVSNNSSYVYVKQRGYDSLTAHYSPNTYELSIVVTPSNGGTTEGEGLYPFGENVTVTAIPEPGFEFICWIQGSDILSYDLSYSFTMPSNDMALTASFGLSEYSINVEPNNPTYGTTTGGGTYLYGTNVTLTAIPESGYRFVLWSEDGMAISSDSLYEFTVTGNRNLVGNFQLLSGCSAPVGLFADPFSENEVLLYWLSSGDEDTWELLWGISGFDTLTGGNLISDLTTVPYLLNNLDPGTAYDFYVKAICYENVVSPWSEVSTFTTWYVGEDDNKASLIQIYPNPAHNMLNVKINLYDPVVLKYRIINMLGESILVGQTEEGLITTIDISQLSSGKYWLSLTNESFSKTFPVIIR